jgi:hypothetical protein
VKYLKFIFPIIALSFLVGLVVVAPRLILIKHISCQSQYGNCFNNLEEKFKVAEGKNLREAKKEIEDILKNDLSLSDYSTQFKIPDTLKISLLEDKPKFALKSLSNNVYGLVNENGLVLKIEDNSSLPYVEIEGTFPNVGEKVLEKEFFALKTILGLYSLYQIDKGKIQNESLLVELKNGIKVIFPLEGDKDVLLGALRVILNRLNEDAKESKINKVVYEIDLRFKNPVLR